MEFNEITLVLGRYTSPDHVFTQLEDRIEKSLVN